MKIIIAGYGLEGKVSLDYWRASGNELIVADERSELESLSDGVTTILGPDAFSKLGEADLIIRSPSIHPKKLPYGDKVWSATNEFFAKCPAPIIGVTGTKGKGTTSSLITSILKAAGKTVHLLGNIGTPALGVLPSINPSDIVVFELSSFQLWDLQKSPQISVVLGIEPDHMDVHASMDEYVAAKSMIARHQLPGDRLVYKADNTYARQIAETSAASEIIEYPSRAAAHVTGGVIYMNETPICRTDELQIPGGHNVENACAAITAAWRFIQDPSVIANGLKAFTGLPHRIKFVRELNGIRYYDDSYSSAVAATVAAVNAFTQPEILILGGYDKGIEFGELAKNIAGSSQVKHVVLMGQTRQKINDALLLAGVSNERITLCDTKDFARIITTATEQGVPGDVIILSPACASFDMFKNFTDRGEQFVRIVESL